MRAKCESSEHPKSNTKAHAYTYTLFSEGCYCSAKEKEVMEEVKEKNWRMEAEENLQRLQSLLLGAEHALAREDFASAYVLALRLLGFLDVKSHSDAVDEAFLQSTRRDALSKLHTARRSLTPQSDRCLNVLLELLDLTDNAEKLKEFGENQMA
ncbi:hypothetical protein V8G54_011221 [Vigna mungo]|uniref:FIGL1 N-terminal domain-containing protein n=1 Tax=Vigna mungo TaxID=3915 RepID=A0AAQ3NPM6_VIGMU